MWNCLSGPHAHFADGRRRRAPLRARLLAHRRLRGPAHPDFATLAKLLRARREFLRRHLVGRRARGLARSTREARMIKMVWDAPRPATMPRRTPRRFGPNTPRRPWSWRDSRIPGPSASARPSSASTSATSTAGGSIAMAGERMCAGDLHEVSGICTHPDFQGRGLARKAHAQAGASPAAARQDAIPARDEPQHAGPRALREDGIPRLPRDGS